MGLISAAVTVTAAPQGYNGNNITRISAVVKFHNQKFFKSKEDLLLQSSVKKKSETKEQPAMQSATDKITSSPAKNPENSSGDSAFSLTTAPGDTSLSPIDYRRSIDPLFDFVMEYTDNGMVNPGREHDGEYFLSVEFIQMLSQ